MELIRIKTVTIDPASFSVYRGRKSIELTKTEFKILYLMMSSHGKILSRQDISKMVWGTEQLNFPRTIDTHISNIRKKIGKIGNSDIIVVRKGVGYKLGIIPG